MARKPAVFLMDEPLSNLDAKLRNSTRTRIVELQRALGTTTVYVTHDQVEAMTMGHRIAVLNQGNAPTTGDPDGALQLAVQSCLSHNSSVVLRWRFCPFALGRMQR